MKICIISSHVGLHAPTRIIEEGQKRGHEMHLTTWEDLYIDISSNRFYFGNAQKSLNKFDAIIPRSDRYSLKLSPQKRVTKNMNTLFRLALEYAKKNNIFFLNSSYFSSYQSLDKLSQQFFFFQNNLPGIETSYFSSIERFKKKYNNFPIVAKVAEGSTGTSVFKLSDTKEINSFISDRNDDGNFFIFQKFHKIRNDYRVLVVGGKALGIMKRSPKNGEWRTNFSLGGNVVAEKDDPEMISLSEEIAKKMGFDYVGIDLLKDNGRIHIIETNSLPQFKGFEKAFPDVNVAKKLIELVENNRQ